MGFEEKPKNYTPEEIAKIEQSRNEHTQKLINNGARLEVTDKQIEEAQQEMNEAMGSKVETIQNQNESGNDKFRENFAKFGLDDAAIIAKLMAHGEIVEVNSLGDTLEVFYKESINKSEKLVVLKSEVKNIDPKTNAVTGLQKHFKIESGSKNYISGKTSSKKPSLEQREGDTGAWG